MVKIIVKITIGIGTLKIGVLTKLLKIEGGLHQSAHLTPGVQFLFGQCPFEQVHCCWPFKTEVV